MVGYCIGCCNDSGFCSVYFNVCYLFECFCGGDFGWNYFVGWLNCIGGDIWWWVVCGCDWGLDFFGFLRIDWCIVVWGVNYNEMRGMVLFFWFE